MAERKERAVLRDECLNLETFCNRDHERALIKVVRPELQREAAAQQPGISDAGGVRGVVEEAARGRDVPGLGEAGMSRETIHPSGDTNGVWTRRALVRRTARPLEEVTSLRMSLS